MGAGVRSPLGEWHYAAPAGRYSAKADELRPGGSSTPAIVGTHGPVALFRGRDARRRAGGSLARPDPPAAQPANHANPRPTAPASLAVGQQQQNASAVVGTTAERISRCWRRGVGRGGYPREDRGAGGQEGTGGRRRSDNVDVIRGALRGVAGGGRGSIADRLYRRSHRGHSRPGRPRGSPGQDPGWPGGLYRLVQRADPTGLDGAGHRVPRHPGG